MARPKGDAAATERRKQLILQSAFDVFAKNGYSGASVKQVADIVGISEAGILHHFKSKSALLLEVLRFSDEEAKQMLESGNDEPLKFVSEWIRLINRNASAPGIVELYCKISAEATAQDHPAHEFFVSRYEAVLGSAVDRFELLKTKGHLREEIEPSVAGRALVAVTDGLQLQWLFDRKTDMAAEVRAFFKSILADEAAPLAKVSV